MTPTPRAPDPFPPARASAWWLYAFLIFQFVCQAAMILAPVGGLRIDEIAVPTRYFEEASSVGFRRSVVYGLSTLRVVARYLMHRTGLRRSAKLRPRPTASEPRAA